MIISFYEQDNRCSHTIMFDNTLIFMNDIYTTVYSQTAQQHQRCKATGFNSTPEK